ncbi:hypothetical protein [Bacillus sp. E214]|uniref:hypothetical protein n=1 Tax=Bacillus sp. E214 TaxID=2587156 RepID=UPI0011E0358B|nr:hypothetical protein [Bacillus sp. E214]
MKDFPNKRDFFYIVGFLIIAIIFIISENFSDNKNIVDYVGFSGTIISILLAVIAIIYSFYQNSTYINSTQKLDITAEKIEEITRKLSEVAEVSGNITYLKDMVDKINSIVTNIETNLYEEIDKKPLPGRVDNGANLTVKMDTDGTFKYDKVYFENVVGNLTVLSAIVVVWIQKCHKLNLNFNIRHCARFFVEDIMMEKDNARLLGIENAINGILIAYEHLYFFDIKKVSEIEFKVNMYDANLSLVIDEGKTNIGILKEHFEKIEKLLLNKM